MSTPDELLREIGVRLREARENRNLTHRDLWRTTRIPIAILDAIERYDRSRLPQSFYVREFVQTYAAEVGLDPAAIADYLSATRSESLGESSNGSTVASAPAGSRAVYGMLAGAVVVGTVGLYGLFFRTEASEAPQPSQDLASPAGEADLGVAAVGLPSHVAAVRELDDLLLKVHVRGSCEVAAVVNGQPAGTHLARDGDTVVVRGNGEITLEVADRGGCAYFLERPETPAGEAVAIRLVGDGSEQVIAAGLASGPRAAASY
jgi:hypothetical protein